MKILKLIIITYILSLASYANEWEYKVNTEGIDGNKFICYTEWMIYKGKKIKPFADNLKSMIIYFDNNMDNLTVKSPNYTSYYKYKNFIDVKALPVMGMSYIVGDTDNHVIYDIFSDGVILIWRNKELINRSNCPNLRLNIKRINKARKK